MKKSKLPATSTQLSLTIDNLESIEAFVKKHHQCKGPPRFEGEKMIDGEYNFEFIMVPPDNKPVIICRNCVFLPKNRIPFTKKDFEAIKEFTREHKCKKAFSLVSTDASVGTALSVYCMECGETKNLTDYGKW